MGELKLIMWSAIWATGKEQVCLKAVTWRGENQGNTERATFCVSENGGDLHSGEGAKQTSGEDCEMP